MYTEKGVMFIMLRVCGVGQRKKCEFLHEFKKLSKFTL